MSNNTRERMMEAQAQNRAEQVLFEIELSDRYKVKLGEITGFDESLVLKHMGKDFQANGSGAMKYRNALVARSVKYVMNLKQTDSEGKAVEPAWVAMQPAQHEAFLNGLKAKEKAKLETAYSEINELSDEEREAVKNAVTPTMGN